MLSIFDKKQSIIVEAQKARFKPNFVLQILIFIGLTLFSQFVAAIPISIIMMSDVYNSISSGEVVGTDTESITNIATQVTNDNTLLLLFCTGLATIIIIVYCRFIEKRSLYSMGFVKKNSIKDYLVGIVIGFVMFGSGVLISFFTGTLTFEGFVLNGGIGLLLAFFAGFIIQGMSEEVMLRGYLMVSITTRNSAILAVVTNSVIFAALHLLNNGVSVLGILNIILFGVFASVYMLRMNSIWGICAIHSVWNFAQGNIFGIRVSGIETPVSVFSFVPKETGTLINGGDFGLEGGLAVTIVLVVSIILVLVLKKKDKEAQANEVSEPTVA